MKREMDQNGVQKAVNATIPPSNRNKKRKIITCIVAVVCAIVFFVGGGVTVWFSLDKELRTLAKIKATIDAQYYKEVTDEEFYTPIFDVVNNQVLDAYSQYMSADEFKQSTGEMAGNRIGIGVVFTTKDAQGKDQMLVNRVCGNSPAEQAGVTVGAYLTGFGKTKDTLQDSVIFQEFSDFLKNFGAGEVFYARFEQNGEEVVLPLHQGSYVENYVFYRTNQKSYTFTGTNADVLTERGTPLTCLNNDTAYVRLVQFAGRATENFQIVMEQFKKDGMKNLVLDLRGNGGGYLDIMQSISGYFCKTATERRPVAAVADYGERVVEYRVDKNVYDDYFAEDSRICVLADVYTASASECLIGVMVDYGATAYQDICLSQRGSYARTFGKGIMQTTFYLGLDLDALKLTTAEILWPKGHSIHGRGVLPTDGALTVAEYADDEAEIAAAIATLFH